jgi:hypothetical protein
MSYCSFWQLDMRWGGQILLMCGVHQSLVYWFVMDTEEVHTLSLGLNLSCLTITGCVIFGVGGATQGPVNAGITYLMMHIMFCV